MNDTPTPAGVRAYSLAGGPDAAAAARNVVLEGLGSGVPQRAVEDIMLVVSELVTNAVRHAGAGEAETISLRVGRSPGAVRIEVRDEQPALEPRQLVGKDAPATGGLGLVVVDALCDWGTEQRDRHKTVWAEYPLEAASQR
jgi:anti-sigma regulatory factor (Ser/Thr protein kinase)